MPDSSGSSDADLSCPSANMRVSLQIAAIFIAVGLGALTVTLLHDPAALIPHPPYGRWVLVRIAVLSSLAILGLLLVVGDDRPVVDDTGDRAMFWRALGLAFLVGALASATFVAAMALVNYLDGAAA
jgi:hypothetical protein